MAKGPTPKQRKLLKLIMENVGKTGKALPMTKILKMAGYSDGVSHNQNVLAGIGGKDNVLLKDMIATREKMVKRAQALAGKAGFRNLVEAIEKYTKVIQLLSGRPTEVFSLTSEEQDDLDRALKA